MNGNILAFQSNIWQSRNALWYCIICGAKNRGDGAPNTKRSEFIMGPLLTFQFWWIEIGAQHTHAASAAHNSAVILFDKFPIQKNLPTCMRMTAAISAIVLKLL